MNEAEAPQILSEAFRLYGSMIAQAFNVPPALKPLVNGDDAVVSVHLNKDNTITLVKYDVKQTKKQIKALEETVKTQEAEVKSLQLAMTTPAESTEEEEPDYTDTTVKIVKPRRRRL